MGGRFLTKCAVALVALVGLPLSALVAQDVPKSDDDTSFDIEPPLLVKPWEHDREPDDSEENAAQPDAAKLTQQLESAKKSAASAARLVKTGVLSKVEAEQRALRVVRLESQLAYAQMIAKQEEVTAEKARFAAGSAFHGAMAWRTSRVVVATASCRSSPSDWD